MARPGRHPRTVLVLRRARLGAAAPFPVTSQGAAQDVKQAASKCIKVNPMEQVSALLSGQTWLCVPASAHAQACLTPPRLMSTHDSFTVTLGDVFVRLSDGSILRRSRGCSLCPRKRSRRRT